jgi:hypothetical protein
MNAKFLTLALVSTLPLSSLAGASEPIASTTVSCTHENWPTRGQVARYMQRPEVLVGEDDMQALDHASSDPDAEAAASAEHVRQYVRKEGRRECWRGATHVRVDFYAPQSRPVAVAVRAAD